MLASLVSAWLFSAHPQYVRVSTAASPVGRVVRVASQVSAPAPRPKGWKHAHMVLLSGVKYVWVNESTGELSD